MSVVDSTPSADAAAGASPDSAATAAPLLGLMMAMFFAFGFCTVLVDTLVPKFRAMFTLSYTEVMLTQFCFFGAYFLVSVPAGWLIGRIGYLRSITVGLGLMAGGAALFVPAALRSVYPGFLAALFILASGVTIVQVGANPVVAMAGPTGTASSRLTLAQALNSLATFIGPSVGAYLILSGLKPMPRGVSPAVLAAYRVGQAHGFIAPFITVAVILLLLAGFCWSRRGMSPPVDARGGGSYAHLLRRRRLRFGILAIFSYVGAEVSIGSSMANYLMQPRVLALHAAAAGGLVSLYWGGAMVGRFAGTALLRRLRPAALLVACATGAALLTAGSAASTGMLAAGLLLAVGLCNSIQFPTIFTLAIEGLGDDTPEASGLICLAIVGGAVLPLITGSVADRVGLSHALLVPALAYLVIAGFGLAVAGGALRAGEDCVHGGRMPAEQQP